MLMILNSQTRKKEEFKPLDPAGKRVNMYTCGPTVYNSLHIGHARAYITPDIVRRYLLFKGYEVRFVTNFTDIDDKIIKRAIKDNWNWREITRTYIAESHRLMLALNVMTADAYPRATDHIPEMVAIVAQLLKNKNAYIASDGDIYFDTQSYNRYGALSGRKLDEEEAGLSGRVSSERMAVKKNQGDFVLWKLLKNDKEEISKGGDAVPRWPSPWGDGRPGWHLECSAMSEKYLGVPFDIHTGGMDLMFPHHEDEKAQTECAFHESLGNQESVRYWVHNEFVMVGGQKSSKSLGNVNWVREMIWPEGPYDPMVLRMMLLSSHYRSPILYEAPLLDEAAARLERIYNCLESAERKIAESGKTPAAKNPDSEVRRRFIAAMDDDFNTAGGLGELFEAVSQCNSAGDIDTIAALRHDIVEILDVLGIRTMRAKMASSGDSDKLAELLLQVRQDVRTAKQYAISDKIRDGLKGLGYEVEDLPGGKSVAKKK